MVQACINYRIGICRALTRARITIPAGDHQMVRIRTIWLIYEPLGSYAHPSFRFIEGRPVISGYTGKVGETITLLRCV